MLDHNLSEDDYELAEKKTTRFDREARGRRANASAILVLDLHLQANPYDARA
jgi:hypothetical protein